MKRPSINPQEISVLIHNYLIKSLLSVRIRPKWPKAMKRRVGKLFKLNINVSKGARTKEPAGLEEMLLQLNATLPIVPLEIAKAKRSMIKRSSAS